MSASIPRRAWSISDEPIETENTRSAYPLRLHSERLALGRAGMPKNSYWLTADAFGVMPPIAKLTPTRHNVSLLSANYGRRSPEPRRGIVGVEPGIPHCSGAFLPPPAVYQATCCEVIGRARIVDVMAGQHRLDAGNTASAARCIKVRARCAPRRSTARCACQFTHRFVLYAVR